MSDKQLILAFFADQPAAETAALALKAVSYTHLTLPTKRIV